VVVVFIVVAAVIEFHSSGTRYPIVIIVSVIFVAAVSRDAGLPFLWNMTLPRALQTVQILTIITTIIMAIECQ